MAKRFSGDVKLTISKREGHDDQYDVKLKAPGCSSQDGLVALDAGYASLHGEDAAYDQAARQYMVLCEQFDDMTGLVAKAVKDGKTYHIGRGKADRWPDGLSSNQKTNKRRRR